MSFFLISHLSSIFFPSISEFFLLKSFCLFINDDDTGIGKSVQFMMLLMMKKANGKQVATFITIFHVRHLCFKSPVCVCLRFYNTFYICLTIYSHFTYTYIYMNSNVSLYTSSPHKFKKMLILLNDVQLMVAWTIHRRTHTPDDLELRPGITR